MPKITDQQLAFTPVYLPVRVLQTYSQWCFWIYVVVANTLDLKTTFCYQYACLEEPVLQRQGLSDKIGKCHISVGSCAGLWLWAYTIRLTLLTPLRHIQTFGGIV